MRTTITVQGLCDQLNAQFDNDNTIEIDVKYHVDEHYEDDNRTIVTLQFESAIEIEATTTFHNRIESEIK